MTCALEGWGPFGPLARAHGPAHKGMMRDRHLMRAGLDENAGVTSACIGGPNSLSAPATLIMMT
eukprot:CAMPEP_0174731046 /NCGR_PEP_ID=MMETSP1094-20130205/56793_1 /TAXON_ID=156173 /ORGANISM="Chrysochromulina brevifilum, Strain UTEX LB 985" /LENGTH=63 /DNA_ID=CAMNT_0015933389 /DNA_START=244 /DNA_END=436 /DNA_ORIENTATION=+